MDAFLSKPNAQIEWRSTTQHGRWIDSTDSYSILMTRAVANITRPYTQVPFEMSGILGYEWISFGLLWISSTVRASKIQAKMMIAFRAFCVTNNNNERETAKLDFNLVSNLRLNHYLRKVHSSSGLFFSFQKQQFAVGVIPFFSHAV